MKIVKFVLVSILGVTTLVSCSTEKKPEPEPVAVVAEEKPPVTYAYTPSYSSSFEIGNPEYAKMIIQGSWKDWEDNNLDNMKNWLSDSVVLYHSDNKEIRGVENVITEWKKGRESSSEVKVTIDAVFPVYSTDKKENWVLVWATEIDKDKKTGKVDTTGLMETWRIDKDGKADLLFQFDRKNRKKK